MIKKLYICILGLLVISSCQTEAVEMTTNEAKAIFHPISLSDIQDSLNLFADYDINYSDTLGVAYIKAFRDRIELRIDLNCNKPNTSSALHMHYGTPSRPKHHWNPEGTENYCDSLSLGEVWKRKFAGDIGNIHFDEAGDGTFFLQTDLWSLNSGDKNDILGKILVIHYLFEDFAQHCSNHNHSHSHQNPKIGSGIIELIE